MVNTRTSPPTPPYRPIMDRDTIVAYSSTHFNLPSLLCVKRGVTVADIPDSEISIQGGTTLNRDTARNALVFTLAASAAPHTVFGLLFSCYNNWDKDPTKVSQVYTLHVDTSVDVAVFNRFGYDLNNYIEALIRTGASGYNLQLEKVVDGASTVLATQGAAPTSPYSPVEFEFYADLDNDVCGATVKGITASGILSSLEATMNAPAAWDAFVWAMSGFENFDNAIRTGIIYMPVVVMCE